MADRLWMFGLPFEVATRDEATRQIVSFVGSGRKGLIVTPNVDHIVTMEQDLEMRATFEEASLRFCDSMPLVWLSRILHPPGLPKRVTGADLLFSVSAAAARQGASLFLLGAAPGVAALAATRLQERNPGLIVKGVHSPPLGFERDPDECRRIVDLIAEARPDILFIGVGTPKQEKWARRWADALACDVVLGVGAAFDFAAGRVRRAPPFLQRAGLEWAYRLAREPRRLWRRYIVNDSRFFLLAAREWRRTRQSRKLPR